MRPLPVLMAVAVLAVACGGGDETATPPSSAEVTTTTAATTTSTAAPSTSAPTTSAPATAPPTAAAPAAPRAAAGAAPAARPAPRPCPSPPPRSSPAESRPRYTLRVDVRPAENVVEGEVTVRFTPDLDTDRLVFRLWANAPRTARAGARLDVGGVLVGGRPVDAVLQAPTLVVARPGGTLLAGRPVDVAVPWRLTLPGPVSDRISRSGDAIRLGSFFPILAWEPGVGWATEPATSGFAEATLSTVADFTATVTVPPGLDVMATGTNDGSGRWTASGVPDFALSVGRFTVASTTVNAPQPVQVTVGVHAGVADSPAVYLNRAARALEDASRRYGAYPWPTYTVSITPQLGGGIEYPMHVLQGPGTSNRTTPHEVAHMWFYGLVGSNQGRDPWLDEGVATFVEGRMDGTLGSMKATAIPAAGRGRVGEPMAFWESRSAAYYRSVYVQGAQALAALGDPELVDCVLRLYAARKAYGVARPRDLVDAAAEVFPDAAAVLAGYGVRT